MKITYVHHSAFLVEWEKCAWLFDFYDDKLPELPEDTPIFVFASHAHPDHYMPHIFGLFHGREDVRYILSNDIKIGARRREKYGITAEDLKNTTFTPAGSVISVQDGAGGEFTVETLKSTDRGVAFLVRYEGKTVYHAGDLNWWEWDGEPDDFNENMRRDFFEITERLRGEKIDAAFLVLDPRQKRHMWLGFDRVMRIADVKAAFPMHFWSRYSETAKFRDTENAEPYRSRVMTIEHRGQTWEL